MIPPRLPPDESERQLALDEYQVAGTEPGPVLLELVRLAAVIGGTRHAAITLIDNDRQWFFATHEIGLETSGRDESVCGHAILTHEFFEVPDLAADERFQGNPLLDPFRFYGGSQLRTGDGYNLGMLCVLDPAPMRLDENQRTALDQLARAVMVLLERRRVARPLEWLGHIADSVREEILVLDPQSLHYLHANGSASRNLGYSLAELRRLTPMDLMPGLTREQFECYVDQLRDGTAHVTYEAERRRANGDTYPVEVRVQMLQFSRRAVIVSLAYDVSERKAIERMKDEFVSVVNHELRTPLTSIHGAVRLLDQGVGGELPPPARRLIAIAAAGSERLRSIVDDILDLDRMASGRMHYDLQPIDADEALAQATTEQEAAARLAQLALVRQSGQDLRVRADPQRLQQMLANLLSNAIKFAPPGSEVRATAEAVGDRVRFTVEDSGPGIPDEFRSRIFERFARADTLVSRQTPGSGLGLAIVRQMALQMGGEVGFESQPGRTVFHITLPRA